MTPPALFKACARSNSASCASSGSRGGIEAAQQNLGGGEQAWIGRQTVLDERQWLTAEHLLDKCRFYVHHPVLESELGPGFAIVDFVRVQHDRPTGQAVAPTAAVLKALHAGEGVTDGVSVMTVQVVAVSGKKRLEALQPRHIGRAVEPVIVRWVPGHADRCLELDAGHVNPVSGCLSSGRCKPAHE